MMANLVSLAASAESVARAELRVRLLEELAEIGTSLMRHLEGAPAHDPAALAELSREVRLTLDQKVRSEEALRRIYGDQRWIPRRAAPQK